MDCKAEEKSEINMAAVAKKINKEPALNFQVKTKKRVTDYGEVFTSEREVNAMLDLVKQETLRIDSRFLEPACGTGNFLAEILRRKLDVVDDRYKKSQLEFERYVVISVSSVVSATSAAVVPVPIAI